MSLSQAGSGACQAPPTFAWAAPEAEECCPGRPAAPRAGQKVALALRSQPGAAPESRGRACRLALRTRSAPAAGPSPTSPPQHRPERCPQPVQAGPAQLGASRAALGALPEACTDTSGSQWARPGPAGPRRPPRPVPSSGEASASAPPRGGKATAAARPSPGHGLTPRPRWARRRGVSAKAGSRRALWPGPTRGSPRPRGPAAAGTFARRRVLARLPQAAVGRAAPRERMQVESGAPEGLGGQGLLPRRAAGSLRAAALGTAPARRAGPGRAR